MGNTHAVQNHEQGTGNFVSREKCSALTLTDSDIDNQQVQELQHSPGLLQPTGTNPNRHDEISEKEEQEEEEEERERERKKKGGCLSNVGEKDPT